MGKTPPECPNCRSSDTQSKDALRTGPSLLFTLLIGWLYLLPRAALMPRKAYCRDCKANFSYRTTGSNVALVILILLIALIVWAGLTGEEEWRGYCLFFDLKIVLVMLEYALRNLCRHSFTHCVSLSVVVLSSMTWEDCLNRGPTELSRILDCPVTTAHSWIRRSGPPEWQKKIFTEYIHRNLEPKDEPPTR